MSEPTPLFTLSVYQEGDQIKSLYTFRDPACAAHSTAITQLLRRALAALEQPPRPRGHVPPNTDRTEHHSRGEQGQGTA